MNKVIHLKVARVYSHNDDGSPKLERTTIKLEDGDNFNKFARIINTKGYLSSEPPKVVKVLEKKNGKYVEVDTKPYQDVININFNKVEDKKVDYKEEYQKQKKENAAILARLEALEAKLSNEQIDETEEEKDKPKLGRPKKSE